MAYTVMTILDDFVAVGLYTHDLYSYGVYSRPYSTTLSRSAYILMTYTVVAYTVMSILDDFVAVGLYSYGLYSYGLYSYVHTR